MAYGSRRAFVQFYYYMLTCFYFSAVELTVKPLIRRAQSDDHGTTLIELMIAMGLLMVIAAVALGSITLAENQQANTYARTVSISQAQLIAEAVTRAIRNANYTTVPADTPIIAASPYELYFYQQSYSNPINNQLAVIWLAGGSTGVSASSPPTTFETTNPGCLTTSPCSVEEKIYSLTPGGTGLLANSASNTNYLPIGSSGYLPDPTKNFGTGVVFSSTATTTPTSCSTAIFAANPASSPSTFTATSGTGIFQLYDGCLNPATGLDDLQTIRVTLQAQYQPNKPLVTITSYVQIRNLSSGS